MWLSKPLTRHLRMLQRQWCAHFGLLRQVIEAGFCVGKETFRHLQPGQLSEINELLDQVAPRRLAL